jgi:hypothetical protein
MIKTITQLVCVKDIYHYATGKLRFQKGKVYDVYKVNTDETLKLQPEDGDRLCEITLDKDYNAFLTLAEWREEQINSILEE